MIPNAREFNYWKSLHNFRSIAAEKQAARVKHINGEISDGAYIQVLHKLDSANDWCDLAREALLPGDCT